MSIHYKKPYYSLQKLAQNKLYGKLILTEKCYRRESENILYTHPHQVYKMRRFYIHDKPSTNDLFALRPSSCRTADCTHMD